MKDIERLWKHEQTMKSTIVVVCCGQVSTAPLAGAGEPLFNPKLETRAISNNCNHLFFGCNLKWIVWYCLVMFAFPVQDPAKNYSAKQRPSKRHVVRRAFSRRSHVFAPGNLVGARRCARASHSLITTRLQQPARTWWAVCLCQNLSKFNVLAVQRFPGVPIFSCP